MRRIRAWDHAIRELGEKIIYIPWNAGAENILNILRNEYAGKIPEIMDAELDEIIGQNRMMPTGAVVDIIGSWLDGRDIFCVSLFMPREAYCLYVSYEYEPMNIICADPDMANSMQTHTCYVGMGNFIRFPHSMVQIENDIFNCCCQDFYHRGNYLFAVYHDNVPPYFRGRVHVFDLNCWPACELDARVETDDSYVRSIQISFRSRYGLDECISGHSMSSLELEIPEKDILSETKAESEIPLFENAEFLLRIGDIILYWYDKKMLISAKSAYHTDESALDFYQKDVCECILACDLGTQRYSMTFVPEFILNSDVSIYQGDWIMLHHKHCLDATEKLIFWNIRTNTYYAAASEKDFMNEVSKVEHLGDGTVVFWMEDGRLIKPEIDLPSWWVEHHSGQAQFDWANESGRFYDEFSPEDRKAFENSLYHNLAPGDWCVVEFDNGYSARLRIAKNE